MASGKEYLDFILEQLSDLDGITFKSMMGEYILYMHGRIFGGIYDDRFLVKPTKSAVAMMPNADRELPYEGAKEMLLVDNVDNREFLEKLLTAMYDELPVPKQKKKHREDSMIDILRNKKVIFFDVGYTLDMPASGDWMFTNRFLELAGEKLKQRTDTEIQRARDAGLRYLAQDHLIQTVEAEIRNFFDYYSIVSDQLDLGLTEEERDRIARDRACNMENYIPYPGIKEVLSTLSKTHKLGIISDTWPSIEPQLKYIGVSQYLSFTTFSCFVGVFKPDKRIYLDALKKCGVPAEETVFIDDAVRNLDGAAALGITPVLIAANPASDVETNYLKIHDLRELIR